MAEPETKVEPHLVRVQKPEELNLTFGPSHFIKTVEDLHEALAGAVPGLRFGLAFCESSGSRLVRYAASAGELASRLLERRGGPLALAAVTTAGSVCSPMR